jgi:hypothetical protein
MEIPDACIAFVAETRAAFDYLVANYGYRCTAEEAMGPEAWVVYEGPSTRITVHYELGTPPWVEVGRLEVVHGKRVAAKRIGLDLLLRERKKKSLDDDIGPPRDLRRLELSTMLQRRADALAEAGDDLLRGNFEAFPRLYNEAERELRAREASFFGSNG